MTPDLHIIQMQAKDDIIWRWKTTAREWEDRAQRATKYAEVAVVQEKPEAYHDLPADDPLRTYIDGLLRTLAGIAYGR